MLIRGDDEDGGQSDLWMSGTKRFKTRDQCKEQARKLLQDFNQKAKVDSKKPKATKEVLMRCVSAQ